MIKNKDDNIHIKTTNQTNYIDEEQQIPLQRKP